MSTSNLKPVTRERSKDVVLPKESHVTPGKIRGVIPKHCFERDPIKSFRYVFQDFALIALSIYVGLYIKQLSILFQIILWPILIIIQGAFMTGIWVIAHECGHQAFSPSLFLNDLVGCILHSMLLVPYWSWKYTHAAHHSNSNSMDRDTVFVPRTKKRALKTHAYKKYGFLRSKFERFVGILKMVVLGWPLYLWMDISGPPTHKNKGWVSHFNPYCAIFRFPYQRRGVIASDIALLVWCYVLFRIYCAVGLFNIMFFYFLPYLTVNFWLITITFLQHTDYKVPKYYSNEWSWLRGALGTVDRDYGIFNILHHHIADTHVLHHLFSKIPHYHAQEASKAIVDSGLIKDFYLKDNTRWYVALWREYRDCWFVSDEDYDNEEIVWFQTYHKTDAIKKEN